MSQKQQEVAKVILADPAVESLSSFIGADGTNTTLNSGRYSINLKPLNVRKMSASDVIRRLQPKIADQVQGIQMYMQPVQDITVDDRVSRTQYQYTLEDPDVSELNEWTNKFVTSMKKMPELEDVATDQQTGGLAVSLTIDRVTASRLGIATATIDNALYDAFGQRQISTMYTQLNQYHVILEALPSFQTSPDKLQSVFLQANASSNATGAGAATSFSSSSSASAGSNAITESAQYTPTPAQSLLAPLQTALAKTTVSTNLSSSSQPANAIPLSTFTHVELVKEPLTITHQGQFPAVTISFNLARPKRRSARRSARSTSWPVTMNPPASLQAGFQGTAASFHNSLSNESLLILAALVTVYIVLGVLYESFIHPVTILSTLPSAGVGALLALMLFGQDLSVVAIIGIILLIGIVKKNGIMIVDFALEAERQHGKSSTEPFMRRACLRFRPIMMTTMAALLGGLPLAFGSGLGSELRRPAGHRHGGRLAVEPGADPLHDASYLYFLRPDRAALLEEAKTTTPAKPRRRPSRHERLHSIYSAAGSDHAAYGGDRHRRRDRLYGVAGLATAAGGFSDDQHQCRTAGRQR
jgi:multidrug efflux pump